MSPLDELPVVWLVVLLDDPPSMNDIHLGTIGLKCRNDGTQLKLWYLFDSDDLFNISSFALNASIPHMVQSALDCSVTNPSCSGPIGKAVASISLCGDSMPAS